MLLVQFEMTFRKDSEDTWCKRFVSLRLLPTNRQTTPIIRSITCRGIGAAKETGMNRHHSFFLCFHGSRHSIFNLLFSCDLVGATMFTFFFSCYHDFLRKTVDNAVKKDYNQDNLTITHVVRTRYAKVVSQRAADGAIVADEIASLPPSPVIRLLVRNK